MTDPHDGAPAFGRFFLPGPTEVLPEILQAQVRPMIGHRSGAMSDLMASLQPGLRDLFRTTRPVYVCSSSATGLMEAAVRNGSVARVLALVNGAFSERFAHIAEACGREVDVLEVPWGGVHDPEEVRRRIEETGPDAVTVVHSETSTGALNPLREISEVVARYPETLLLVDSVSGIGGAELRFDDWNLDFVVTGSQKALALPPGLALGVASPRLLERAASVPGRGAYFDLLEFEERMGRFQTPNTPALSLIYALEAQLERIAAEGVEARWERHLRMARLCWEWVREARDERGMEVALLPPPGHRSPTVSCIRLPRGLTGPAVVAGLRERDLVIAAGYGRLRDETIRVGHMGDHTVAELSVVLEALDEVLSGATRPGAAP